MVLDVSFINIRGTSPHYGLFSFFFSHLGLFSLHFSFFFHPYFKSRTPRNDRSRGFSRKTMVTWCISRLYNFFWLIIVRISISYFRPSSDGFSLSESLDLFFEPFYTTHSLSDLFHFVVFLTCFSTSMTVFFLRFPPVIKIINSCCQQHSNDSNRIDNA